jgi:hypothetical protein
MREEQRRRYRRAWGEWGRTGGRETSPAATHTRTYIVMPARPSTWLLFMVVWVHILFITSTQLEAQATLY